MIISKEFEVVVSYNKIALYRELGFFNLKQGDKISLPIEYLSKTSRSQELIEVQCDYCSKVNTTTISKYCYNVIDTNKYSCRNCIVKKSKETCLKKYGVDNISKLPEIHNKHKETCLKKYGIENYRNIEKRIDTISDIGEEIYYNNRSQKYKETCIEKYGVENASQNSVIFSKQQKNRYTIKQYKNTELTYQGTYEKDFLDVFYDKIEITSILPIDYIYNNKNKKYFPDFYIPKYNLIIEIKSLYTYNKHIKQNIEKRNKCISDGYNFLFIINKNYTEFIKYIRRRNCKN